MAERAIILMNLGSPDSASVTDVKRYLTEFLMDERVIDIPKWKRILLVKGIIVPFRSPKSAKAYESIWTDEGSPLIVLTKKLQEALSKEIEDPIYIAMRYANPSPKAAYDQIVQENPDIKQVIAIPLYPHYAMSSYETAAVYAKEIFCRGNYPFKLTVMDIFYNCQSYLDALATSIEPFLKEPFDKILFSYHGIPERHIIKGDITGQHCLQSDTCCSVDSVAHTKCYRHQCISTTLEIASRLQLPADKFGFSFQSRLGRDEWLKPYTAKLLTELPQQGIKKLLVVCPAFTADCLETLEEMAEEGQELFLHAGGTSFTLIPCLNDHPAWVSALAKWVSKIEAA